MEYKVIKWEINGDGFQNRVNEAVAAGWNVVHFSTEVEVGKVVGICVLEKSSG